jgi:hypothetical protein
MANERTLFQRLAELRLLEAKLLFRERQPSGAYYLAGYAIECALKAIIAAQFRANEIPDKAMVNRVYLPPGSRKLRRGQSPSARHF